MKRSIIYLIGLLTVLTVSCVQEDITNTGDGLIITGSVGPESRVSFVQGDGVIETHWEEGDLVELMPDGQSSSSRLKYKASTAGRSTEFVLAGDNELANVEGTNVYAYYPYADNKVYFGGPYARIPSTDNAKGSSLSPFLYGNGVINNNRLSISFKHYFSYIKFKVSVEDIKKIFNEYIAGYNVQASDYDLTKTYLYVTSTADISQSSVSINLKDLSTLGGYNRYDNFYLHLDDIDYTKDGTYTYLMPVLPLPAGAEVKLSVMFVKNGETYGYGHEYGSKTVPENGFLVGHAYNWEIKSTEVDDGGEDDEEVEEEVVDNAILAALLKDFYDSTNGPYWHDNTNWLSDNPVGNWHGITVNTKGEFSGIWLRANNLSGRFPETLADIMDKSEGLSPSIWINYNQLGGTIPDRVKNHGKWPYCGWYIIPQWPFEEPTVQNYNLYSPDKQGVDLSGNSYSLHEIFSQNTLTQVIKAYDDSYKVNTTFLKEQICPERVNLHLDHKGKKFQTLVFVGDGTEEEIAKVKSTVSALYGDIEGMRWLIGKSPIPAHEASCSYFFDSSAQLKYFAFHQYGMRPTASNLLYYNLNTMSYNNSIKALTNILGQPVSHDKFEFKLYTSSDYSCDGAVEQLQKHSVGNGIKLIFMGDQFVDKDMGENGYYEQTMRTAMENFFSIEPYASFRNRFDVYMVKVVSANAESVEGAEHRINKASAIATEYALKVPDNQEQQLMISVIHNPNYASTSARSFCNMFTDGDFVSFILGPDTDGGTLIHESGGHGFAKLKDEYVELGYGEIGAEAKQSMEDNWIQYGWGANVDWRCDESTVKWASFLSDPLYEGEGLGVFEGAALYAKGAYRATDDSIMRSSYKPAGFNAPSREQIYKVIMKLSEGDDWTYDRAKFVEYDKKNLVVSKSPTVKQYAEPEKRNMEKTHQPPIIIKGSLRDMVGKGNAEIQHPSRF